MQFNSLVFIFVFLPILFITYYLTKERYRNIVLLLFSIVFYACGALETLLLMIASASVYFTLARLIIIFKDKNKVNVTRAILCIGIALNIIILGYYKYYDFFVESSNKLFASHYEKHEIFVPLGVSFFTFKSISFLVDVYSGKIKQINIVEAASYLLFFAQIQSGPISRYYEFVKERNYSEEMITSGVARFMTGLCKKVLIADVLYNVVVEVFEQTSLYSTSLVWLGSICFSLQLYFDFSGYSDMAIGLGNMLGIYCSPNFDYPYFSKSVSEFWRRWHISLGSWFRDYVYIPLGGSKVGKIRLYLNLLVVWILTGIWHGNGLNFIVWGLLYGVIICFEKSFEIPKRLQSSTFLILYRIGLLVFINCQWVLFRANSLEQAMQFIKCMFIPTQNVMSSIRAGVLLRDYAVFIAIAVILAVPIRSIVERIEGFGIRVECVQELIEGVLIGIGFIISIAFIVSGQNNPFIYGNF